MLRTTLMGMIALLAGCKDGSANADKNGIGGDDDDDATTTTTWYKTPAYVSTCGSFLYDSLPDEITDDPPGTSYFQWVLATDLITPESYGQVRTCNITASLGGFTSQAFAVSEGFTFGFELSQGGDSVVTTTCTEDNGWDLGDLSLPTPSIRVAIGGEISAEAQSYMDGFGWEMPAIGGRVWDDSGQYSEDPAVLFLGNPVFIDGAVNNSIYLDADDAVGSDDLLISGYYYWFSAGQLPISAL